MVRQGAIDPKVKGWESLSGAQERTQISELIHDEADVWEKRGVTKDKEKHPNTSAVMGGCMAIGKDFPNMIQAIHIYAARNDIPQNPINHLNADGNFPKIANFVYDDLTELENIMPVDLCEEDQFMRAVLLKLRDLWFKIRKGGEYEIKPFIWLPKQTMGSNQKWRTKNDGRSLALNFGQQQKYPSLLPAGPSLIKNLWENA